ncbi:hypothetical protein UFOVP760_248 [uncultured Caudovirales phage]|uniref:Uncharacterized protein n=1 Tax=uncultured Caudovirales phage TaxID=2100421 RepID=A0A6J7X759_9CAUD|nr:hypothetical protein UFOVP760_248 [uncultured Caudovirales phage]
MVKDIYAIYESYVTKESVGNASANHTERGNINTHYRSVAQGTTYNDLGDLGENEESKQPVATLKGSININDPENTTFSLRGAGVVAAKTIRDRLGRVLEVMNTKAGQGDYTGIHFLLKDLSYYIQANQEVSEVLSRK